MKRNDFSEKFIELMKKKILLWIPEEATEELMLDIMLKRIAEHEKPIREVLLNEKIV